MKRILRVLFALLTVALLLGYVPDAALGDVTYTRTVSGVTVALIGLALFTLAYDLGFLYLRRDWLKQRLDCSNMAVYRAIDLDRLARGEIGLRRVEGEDAFRAHLQQKIPLCGQGPLEAEPEP